MQVQDLRIKEIYMEVFKVMDETEDVLDELLSYTATQIRLAEMAKEQHKQNTSIKRL